MTKFVQPSLLTTSTHNTSNRSLNQTPFQVSVHPTIRLKPTSGFAGTSTTVVGDHFARKVSVSVSFGRWWVAKTKTNQKGHFILSFRVPLLALKGFDPVKAVSANKKQSASASFIVVVPQPSASLHPDHGLPRARITLKGKNFTRKGRVLILFIDPLASISSVGITVGHITASASGTINARFTVPSGLLKGLIYKIEVLDIRSEHSISFNFTIE